MIKLFNNDLNMQNLAIINDSFLLIGTSLMLIITRSYNIFFFYNLIEIKFVLVTKHFSK